MWYALRYGLVLLLAATAVAKLLMTEQLIRGNGVLASIPMLSLAVGGEFFASLCLALARPFHAFLVACGTFVPLTAFAFWAWSGEHDCNCFGTLTPSGVPLVIDLSCLVAIAVAYPSARREDARFLRSNKYSIRIIATVSIAAIMASGVTWRIAHNSIVSSTVPTWFGENLLGQPFPMLPDEAARSLLNASDHIAILFVRPDCGHCQVIVDRLSESKSRIRLDDPLICVSIAKGAWTFDVELSSRGYDDLQRNVVVDWIDADEPFVETPTLILESAGVVTTVISGDAVIDAIFGPQS